MFAINNKLYFALGTFLVNLSFIDDTQYDIVVYEYDLSDAQKLFLRNKFPQYSIIFVRYSLQDWMDEHNIGEDFNDEKIKRYTHLNFSKHKIFQLLEVYSKVLYLDVDVLAARPVSPVFEYENVVIPTSSVPFIETFKQRLGEDLWNAIDKSFIDDSCTTMNGGMFYCDNHIDYVSAYRTAVECVGSWANMVGAKTSLDELVFMYVVYRNKLSYTKVSRGEWNSRPFQNSSHPHIIHFVGVPDKPWSGNTIIQALYPQWIFYYQKWLEMGGEPRESFEPGKVKDFYMQIATGYFFIKLLPFIDFHKYKDLSFRGYRQKLLNVYEFGFHDDMIELRITCNSIGVPLYILSYRTENSLYLRDRYFRETASDIVGVNKAFFSMAVDDKSLCISTAAIAEKDVVNGFRYFLDRISILYK